MEPADSHIALHISQNDGRHYSSRRFMLADSLVDFSSPASLAIAIALVFIIVAAAVFRRITADRWVLMFIFTGALLLAFAAGEPNWNRAGKPSIIVMVDLSPSTRGATFRDRRALDSRIHQLLGDQPFEMIAFSDANHAMPDEGTLPDLTAERTRFSPPVADAIVLLSDGQFELPAYAPPTFPVIDPALDHPDDAAVTELKIVGIQAMATVTGLNPPRTLQWAGAVPDHPVNAEKRFTQLAAPTGQGEVIAHVSPGDRWPENDSLSIFSLQPIEKQKWWVSEQAPPPGWTAFMPAAMPTDIDSMLRTSIIVLSDVDARTLSFDQQAHLSQYVRDFGGSLTIVGGPHAFAAGGYGNTALDDLSPLASTPPAPAMQWMLLIDGSGSMAGDPWKTEVEAFTRLIPQLPTADTVSIGSFAETLAWWSTGKSAGQTQKLQLPPLGISPHGPTNLSATLNNIAEKSDGSVVTHLLLMTDADAELPASDALAHLMLAKKLRLHLLAIGKGDALNALTWIANQTGGSVTTQLDPAQWVHSASLLLRSALPDHYQRRVIALTPAQPATISQWNQTWLKTDATQIQASPDVPIIANWHRGMGQVTSIAYPAAAFEIEKYAQRIQQSPADPRFTVYFEQSAKVHVKVRAIDQQQFMNGLSINLKSMVPREPDSPVTTSLPQTGPGEYQTELPSASSPRVMSVWNDQHLLSQFAVAGRYAEEFGAIGNNMEHLRLLAERTGGRVIYPGPVKPLALRGSVERIGLTWASAFAGFAAIALGMIRHRRNYFFTS